MISCSLRILLLGFMFSAAFVSAAERAYLGVQLLDLSQDICNDYETNDYSTILYGVIIFVQAGSPAAEAGLKHGDVLIELDGVSIQKPADAVDIVRNSEPGEKFVAVALRHGLPVSVHGEYVALRSNLEG